MNTNDFIEDLRKELVLLINSKYKKESKTIKNDIDQFLENSKEKLIRWTEFLTTGQLTPEEYSLLISSQKDLFVMKALHKTGISNISLGHFKNRVIELIISKALALLI